jgi:hypothetical protein
VDVRHHLLVHELTDSSAEAAVRVVVVRRGPTAVPGGLGVGDDGAEGAVSLVLLRDVGLVLVTLANLALNNANDKVSITVNGSIGVNRHELLGHILTSHTVDNRGTSRVNHGELRDIVYLAVDSNPAVGRGVMLSNLGERKSLGGHGCRRRYEKRISGVFDIRV